MVERFMATDRGFAKLRREVPKERKSATEGRSNAVVASHSTTPHHATVTYPRRNKHITAKAHRLLALICV
jgi:hypothetical protein